jgi:hypothetical protein
MQALQVSGVGEDLGDDSAAGLGVAEQLHLDDDQPARVLYREQIGASSTELYFPSEYGDLRGAGQRQHMRSLFDKVM